MLEQTKDQINQKHPMRKLWFHHVDLEDSAKNKGKK